MADSLSLFLTEAEAVPNFGEHLLPPFLDRRERLLEKLALTVAELGSLSELLRFDRGLLFGADLVALSEKRSGRKERRPRLVMAHVTHCPRQGLDVNSESREGPCGDSIRHGREQHEQITGVGGAAESLLHLVDEGAQCRPGSVEERVGEPDALERGLRPELHDAFGA